MSLRDRTQKARKDQEARKSGIPKIAPDTYTCMLESVKYGPSKKGNVMFTLGFQIRTGEETKKEFTQEKFNIFYLEKEGWAMDIIYVMLEDMGVDLDWIDTQENESDAILECLEAAIGEKKFKIYCQRNKNDEKRNQYYLNESPENCLSEEEPFGVEVTSTKKAPKKEAPVKEEAPKKEAPLEDEEKDEVKPSTAADDQEWEDNWDED